MFKKSFVPPMDEFPAPTGTGTAADAGQYLGKDSHSHGLGVEFVWKVRWHHTTLRHAPIHTAALDASEALGAEVALLTGIALCRPGAVEESASGARKALICALTCHVCVLRAFILHTGHAVVTNLRDTRRS